MFHDIRSPNFLVGLVGDKNAFISSLIILAKANNFNILFLDHRGYVNNKKIEKTTSGHFNNPGHSLSDMTVTALEQVKKNDLFYRREREKYFINKFNTVHIGMNKQK